MKRLLLEAGLVAIAGGALALLANQVSPRGIKLSRDYFPAAPARQVAASTNTLATDPAKTKEAAVMERIRRRGFGYLNTEQVADLFRGPQYQQGLTMFVDARDDEHYKAGHVPGAYQLYYGRPDPYLPTVLPLSQAAEKIVVYCTGGDCEDSENTAVFLQNAGVSAQKVFVYGGGFNEWKAQGLPVETGERLSGQTR